MQFVQLVLQNREKLQNYKFKVLFTSDVMKKVYLKAGLHACRFLAKIYL